MSNSIKDQLALAIGARKDSLKALRARIIDLLDDVPVGVRLNDDQGLVVKVVRVCTGLLNRLKAASLCGRPVYQAVCLSHAMCLPNAGLALS